MYIMKSFNMYALSQLHTSHDEECTGQQYCNLAPKVKVNGQIMHCLVNASPPKPLDIATSISTDV